MDSNVLLSTIAIIISILGSIYTIINHKRIKSQCCGSKPIVLASIDIDSTTPEIKPNNSTLPSYLKATMKKHLNNTIFT